MILITRGPGREPLQKPWLKPVSDTQVLFSSRLSLSFAIFIYIYALEWGVSFENMKNT